MSSTRHQLHSTTSDSLMRFVHQKTKDYPQFFSFDVFLVVSKEKNSTDKMNQTVKIISSTIKPTLDEKECIGFLAQSNLLSRISAHKLKSLEFNELKVE